MIKKYLFNKIPLKCFNKSCSDEITGFIAIILGVICYILQFTYTEESMNVSSFSIVALFFGCFSELSFAIQGYQKKSLTIVLTRLCTFLGFLAFIIMWFIKKDGS